jgi:hypothetical protein
MAVMPATSARHAGGRPSNTQLSDRLERSRLRVTVLQDEIVAMAAEREDVATEVRALSARIQLAIHADRPDVALHVAGRLDALGRSLTRRGSAA